MTVFVDCIPILNDNYVWVLHDGVNAVVVDTGDCMPVVDYLIKHQLNLSAILITHHHHDHTGGVGQLQADYQPVVVAHCQHGVRATKVVDEGDTFTLLGLTFKVWRTAGHTDTHLSYLVDFDSKTHVFCGDTLFSGGCGRVFSGTIDELFDSLQRFSTLAEDTIFYPAHEYTLSNLAFGAHIAPQNTAIVSAIAHAKDCQNQGIPTLPVSLTHERAVNVFLQVGDDYIKDRLVALGKLTNEKVDARMVFVALRELKNKF